MHLQRERRFVWSTVAILQRGDIQFDAVDVPQQHLVRLEGAQRSQRLEVRMAALAGLGSAGIALGLRRQVAQLLVVRAAAERADSTPEQPASAASSAPQ